MWEKHDPLVFGKQTAFFIDEDRFIPYRMVVYGNALVAAKSASLLNEWGKWSGNEDRVSNSQGAFISDTDVRMPDIAYMPRVTDGGLSTALMWRYHSEPFAPGLVVEIDNLSDERALNTKLSIEKMLTEYFPHDVVLRWSIYPRPGCRKMYEYYLDEDEQVQCSDNTEWRDLVGRDGLPASESTQLSSEGSEPKVEIAVRR